MRRPTPALRALALIGTTSLALVACGSSGGGGTPEAGGGSAAPSSAPAKPNQSNGVLTFGTLLPETGSLAFLGPPEIAGANLALQDINAAGGVLGKPAALVQGDSGDTESNIAPQTVDRLLSQDADVIVGAASSSVSLTVIDKITGAGAVHFSPANTSDEFTSYPDQGLYFRTAPPDTQQGTVLGQYIAERGVQNLGILALQDAYGEGLANQVERVFTESGGQVTGKIIYDPKAATYTAEVDQIKATNPDGILVVGFDESQKVITSMVEKGIGPQNVPVFGVDGNIGGLGELFTNNPQVLTGMVGTQPQAELTPDFQARLKQLDPALTTFAYSGETYDAMIISALAAEQAKNDSGRAIAGDINAITQQGEKCTSFQACKAISAAGGDIDYDGVGGTLDFTDAGEPSKSSFALYEYTGTPEYGIQGYRLPE